MAPNDHVLLLATDQSSMVPAIEKLLADDGIPYTLGVMPGPPPRAVFTVPGHRLDDARVAVASEIPMDFRDADEGSDETEEEAADRRAREREALQKATFPGREIFIGASLATLHLAIVFLLESPLASRIAAFNSWGLRPELAATEPWRLVSSLFLHSDAGHALRNAVSMIVFAVPLMVELGLARTGLIYLVSGLGGGLAASMATDAGTTVIGSSGAVAGLFGAWVAMRLRTAVLTRSSWRSRMRAAGVAVLVLPSFLSPFSADGRRISVSSHIGGLLAGLAIGAVLAGALLLQQERISSRRTD